MLAYKPLLSKLGSSKGVSEKPTANELLESVGIALIANRNRPPAKGLVAISPTTDPDQAQILLQEYTQAPYSQFRQSLNISYHWILLLNPELNHSINDLIEASLYWCHDNDPIPECAIIQL